MLGALQWLVRRWNDAPPIYFFHIPKTAGTSLRVLAEQQFAPDDVCPAYYTAELLALPDRQLASYRFYRGHFYTLFHSLVPNTRTFTFLRDPIERSLSHYQEVLRTPTHPLHRLAHEQGGLLEYLRDPATQHTVANFQTRSLLWQADARELATRFSEEELACYALEMHVEADLLPHLSEQALLDQAIERLESFHFVGLADQFEESVIRLFARFGWAPPGAPPRENVSRSRCRVNTISRRERDLLWDLTAVDRRLYAHAEQQFRRARVPVGRPTTRPMHAARAAC